MKKYLLPLLLILLSFMSAVPTPLCAQKKNHVLVLEAQRHTWNAAPFTYVRPDANPPLQEQQIAAQKDFTPPSAESDMLWLDKSASGYWLKLQVRSHRDKGRFILSTNWPSYWDWIGFSSFTFYTVDDAKNTSLAAQQVVRDGRLAEGFNPATPFAREFFLRKGQSKTFYIHLSGQDLPLPLTIETTSSYARTVRCQDFISNVYYGIILSLVIFTFALALTLRELRLFWFVAYVATECMLFLISNGNVFIFFGQTDLMLWNKICFILLGLVGVTTGLLAIKFPDLKTTAPSWRRALIVYALLSFVYALGCLWISNHYFYVFCLFFVCILALGPYLALGACIAASRRTGTRNGFFIAAWSVWIIGGTVDLLCYAGIIPYALLVYHCLTLTSAGAGLLLMLALAERVNGLRREKEIAQATSQAKNIFIAKVSHELRTPMNAILGLTELVLDSPLSLEQRDQLETVQQSGRHLLNVVNNVLDFSSAETNNLKLHVRHYNLHKLLRETLKGLSVLAVSKGLQLHWRQDANVPCYVQGDSQRLRQILVNLVGNAVKFTDHGRVDVTVKREGQASDDTVRLRFTVTDTGPGIPAEQLPRIFSCYTQTSQTHGSEGAGLGLSICKELVSLMGGGAIQVQSETDKGSVFSFAVTLNPGRKEAVFKEQTTVPEMPNTTSVKILIVDDSLINVKVAATHLSRLGYATEAASDGQEALHSLAADDFDMVLMDMEMPGLNGVDTIKRIRSGQDNVRNPEIPIIVLTAFNLANVRNQCQDIGVSDFMLKPVSFQDLASRINTLIFPDQPARDFSALGNSLQQQNGRPVLDCETAKLRLALDEESYQSIFELSLKELRDLQKRITTAQENDTLVDATDSVHIIKSTAATIGAMALQHAAVELEHLLRGRKQGDPKAAVESLHQALNLLFVTCSTPHTSATEEDFSTPGKH